MTHKVFIDGEVGTTGLQIRARLEGRDDIRLVTLGEADRKNTDARLAAFAEADVGILCLPDAAAIEIVAELAGTGTRLIDASTAHRVDPDWVFGFPEMESGLRDRIASGQFVSNPGCYSTGAIALLHPLVQRGLIAADAALSINAISGYSGGGKSMIAEFESGQTDGPFVYATDQRHKHLPEIIAHVGLSRRPVFVPSVGPYEQGMIVQVPLPHLEPGESAALHSALAEHYAGSAFVSVVAPDHYGARIDPRRLNGTNRLELSVHGNPDTGGAVLIALLDNLGKGASGAAVQNLNIMLGLDESLGL
ncbi:N-acetyl-gamma-glutamyl-phosphate reductase [Ruegeria sp. PrR005]|uniref:N-acetyl-gamma-glutamyl-phosphate reductase n=1 Tax=Ruegeria sp. PrR005 TaxID=2706882 RepID=A0A6B2NWU9_9RHOB|nr:N-acetyl-gamma-glutamyl-phosphate reductase [Ruegeria sp. PrR005]NDW47928.1 N-acetyl-gamma-glutamyl-phosphate reductase [Ruegeria sp. PrR005]